MLPIGDDDSDRRFAPLINYVLIAINVLVFVFLQGMGGNEKFTYAFSTVPAEILTGKDIAAGVLEPTPVPCLFHSYYIYVYAWRLGSSFGKHVIPMGLWR
jgi:membrane associated rhomboid family serine protease